MKFSRALLFSIIAHATLPLAQADSITHPLVEHRVSPVGIDALKPRFSWQLEGGKNGLRQTAYQIEVARTGDAGSPPVWDSGWMVTDQSRLVAYAGPPLVSSTPYF